MGVTLERGNDGKLSECGVSLVQRFHLYRVI